MWTASQLHPCGYSNILSKKRKRPKSTLLAMEKGTEFHECIQFQRDSKDPEVQEWVVKARTGLNLPEGALTEFALGLSPAGRYVQVREVEPHVYEPTFEGTRGTLLTAGRADVMWEAQRVTSVGDFKSGKTQLGRPITLPQLLALGFAAADRNASDAMRVGVYYARDGLWDWSDVIGLESSEAGDAWELVQACALADEKPKPGDYCGTCWERKSCEFAR